MESQGPLWTDIAQVALVGGQLVFLVAAALFAWRQVTEARKLREDQTRPFVVIDLDSPHRPSIDLVVKNIGTTMARDVTFEFTPPLESSIDAVATYSLKLFQNEISSLPPGKEIRTLFDSGIERSSSHLPDVYEATVRYRGQTKRAEYEETITLDFGVYWNQLKIDRRDVHDVHEVLKKIREEIRQWSPVTGRGLLRVTQEEVDERAERARRRIEDQERSEG